jgi:hypothetical protein
MTLKLKMSYQTFLSDNMPPRRHLTRDEAAQGLGRLLAGQSQRQVAQANSTNQGTWIPGLHLDEPEV